jgi:hypothetical protein
LVNLIGNPKISHFHGTRTLSFDGAIDDTHGGGVIAADFDRRLGMAHLVKDNAQDLGLLAIEKKSTEFGLRGGCSDEF